MIDLISPTTLVTYYPVLDTSAIVGAMPERHDRKRQPGSDDLFAMVGAKNGLF